MRLNQELKEWYDRIDPQQIQKIHEVAKAQGISFRQALTNIVRTGQARGWIRRENSLPPGSPVGQSSDTRP